MQRIVVPIACIFFVACSMFELRAQEKLLSPRDSVFLSLDTNKISVNYGRPSIRGRKIMGELVPWNEVWRTGANEATHLKTNFDLVMGGVPVPAGTYTLWTLPSEKGWKFIINKETKQWGTKYDERMDLARFDAKVEHISSPVETLTVALEAKGKTSGILKLTWENTVVSTPFEKNDKIRPISPNDSTEFALGGGHIKIKYGRTSIRGRRIWGVVVPMDSIWRTGANNATWFVTATELKIENATVPKGSYTLYTLPTKDAFTLIISKVPGGDFPNYKPKEDLARITMTMEKAAKTIDPFTIWFEAADKNSGILRLGWDDRTYSVNVKAR